MSPMFGRRSTEARRATNGGTGIIRLVPRRFGSRSMNGAKARRGGRGRAQQGSGVAPMVAGMVTAGAGLWSFMGRNRSGDVAKRDRERDKRMKANLRLLERQMAEAQHTGESWNWRELAATIQDSPVARQAAMLAASAPERIVPIGRGFVRTANEQIIPVGILAVQSAREQVLPRAAETARVAGEQVGQAAMTAAEAVRKSMPTVQAGLTAVGETAGQRLAWLRAQRKPAPRWRRGRAKGMRIDQMAGSATEAVGSAMAPVGSALGSAVKSVLMLPLVILGAIARLFWALFVFAFKLSLLVGLAAVIFYIYFPEREQREAFFERIKAWWNQMTGASALGGHSTPEEQHMPIDDASSPRWQTGEQTAS